MAYVLAEATRNLRIIVQDLPETAQKGREILPAELKGQVEFVGHNFFSEQPVRGADVYFFRWIFHNWGDKYCFQILRALIPALKKGARVIANEYVLLDGAETRLTEKYKAQVFESPILGQCFVLSVSDIFWPIRSTFLRDFHV